MRVNDLTISVRSPRRFDVPTAANNLMPLVSMRTQTVPFGDLPTVYAVDHHTLSQNVPPRLAISPHDPIQRQQHYPTLAKATSIAFRIRHLASVERLNHIN